MLISFAWLHELAPGLPADPAEVARRLTSRGLTVDAVVEAEGDAVFDIDVPANRPDALGHRGVAREAAAACGVPLAPPHAAPRAVGRPTADDVSVAVEAPDLCGRYTAGVVRGVRVGPSPPHVAARLRACGLRPINNVVDASNLVMLELGQPVHFFDLATLRGPAVVVRRAARGETLTTLDGAARSLDGEMLVIGDAERGVALAGVIGGADTEISESTRDVLVEAAWFLPRSVRRTARALGVSTDASQRFERGCDPEAPPVAQALAARLLAELAGGAPAPAPLDVHPRPAPSRTATVRLSRAARLLGYAPTADEAEGALSRVGLAPRVQADVVHVTIPSWRVDLEREADLVEEIGRDLGYDRIPMRRPFAAPRPAGSSGGVLEERMRDRLAGLGFSEALTYAMIPPGDDAPFVPDGAPAGLALANPIAEPLSVLRRAIAPGLLRAVDQNLRRGLPDVRLFEVGHVFLARAPGVLPHEPVRVAFAWSGSATPPHWSGPARPVDAFDAAGIVEDLLGIAAPGAPFKKAPAALPGLHPGRATAWRDASGRLAAWSGPAHPELAARYGLSAPVFLGEVDLEVAAASAPVAPSYRPTPRLPSIFKDLSIVLDPGSGAADVVAALEKVAPPAPAAFTWTDRYTGAPLTPGQAAMTLRVILQPLERTLTDAEAESYRARLLDVLETVPGARLRRIDT